jgi:hypothetical protein
LLVASVLEMTRPQHRHIKEIVVPIHFDANKDHLGEGGFGQVYKVTLLLVCL